MQSTETWKTIPGYEGIYEVSDHGGVMSLGRSNAAGKNLRPRPLRPVVRGDGYEQVELRRDGERKVYRVHTLVLLAFRGAPEARQECRHLDGNRRNNLLSNLAWGTGSENIRDQVRHGTHPMASKTVCSRGHLLATPNLVSSRPEARICLACARARHYAWTNGRVITQQLADAYYEALLAGSVSPARKPKTHCPYGHLLASPNLVRSRLEEGHRICLACSRGRATARSRAIDVRAASDDHYVRIMS